MKKATELGSLSFQLWKFKYKEMKIYISGGGKGFYNLLLH